MKNISVVINLLFGIIIPVVGILVVCGGRDW